MNDKLENISDDLRKRAEAALSNATIEVPAITGDDARKLIHDLRVHQVELEMQNEELRTSRNELEIARDAYARLYNQSPIGYVSLDKNGMVSKANQTFLDMTGTHGQIKNRPFAEFLRDESIEIFMGRFGAFFRQPEGKTLDLKLRSPDPGKMVRLTARREQGGESLFVAVIDISEQSRAEARVKALLEEKQLLLREVHHRIKNNMNVAMSLLSIQSDNIKDPAASAVIDDARIRMMSMLLIYEKLYRSDNFMDVSASDYLSQLLDMIQSQFDSSRIVIDRNLDDFQMDSSVLFPLGIILNELITNAFKHAFLPGKNGRIDVRLHRENDGAATLTVSDTGRGLPSGVSPEKSKGFGTSLVRALVDQIHGSMKSETSAGTGARFEIHFQTEKNNQTH